MNRRELLRELSRVQATWINRNTPGTGELNLTAEQEQDYLLRISEVFERVREQARRRRAPTSSRATRAQAAIELLLAFNPQQKRDARGRWTKGGAGIVKAATPSAADILRSGLDSGVARRRPLSGGDMASVDLVTFNDGTEAVRKVTRKVPTGRTPKDQNDAEELAAKVAAAVGVRAPAVHRVSDNEILMEYEPDQSPGNTFPSWRQDRITATPDGLRMGLLDLLIENPDRHGGNYLVSDDEQNITAIDHGFSWDELEDFYPSPFTRAVQGRSNPFSPADMQAARTRLEALRADFESMGHSDWHERMMEIFNHVEQRATGTERLLP